MGQFFAPFFPRSASSPVSFTLLAVVYSRALSFGLMKDARGDTRGERATRAQAILCSFKAAPSDSLFSSIASLATRGRHWLSRWHLDSASK